MELERLQALAGELAANFASDELDRNNAKARSQEAWAVSFAKIKRDGAQMTDGDHVNLVCSFGVHCTKAGMAKGTVAARKADLRCILEHYEMIPDGAKAFRPTVDGIRLQLTPMLERLQNAVKKAIEAQDKAREALATAEAELVEYQAGIESGIIKE